MTRTSSSIRKVPVRLSPDGALWPRVAALTARVTNEVEKALQRKVELGFSEFLALLALSDSDDGELRMQELAEATSLNQSSATRLVGRLQQAGLSERRMCEHDRRGVYTGITAAGRKTLLEAVPIYEAALKRAFGQAAVEEDLEPLLNRIRQ